MSPSSGKKRKIQPGIAHRMIDEGTNPIRCRLACGSWACDDMDRLLVGLDIPTLGVGGVWRSVAAIAGGDVTFDTTVPPLICLAVAAFNMDVVLGRCKEVEGVVSPVAVVPSGMKRSSVEDMAVAVSGGSDWFRAGQNTSVEAETEGLGSSLGAGEGRTIGAAGGL
jgi:hypothetical protein